jgi:hypothetical protein
MVLPDLRDRSAVERALGAAPVPDTPVAEPP